MSWWRKKVEPAPAPEPAAPRAIKIHSEALGLARARNAKLADGHERTWRVPEPPPGILPKGVTKQMAMDWAEPANGLYQFTANGLWSEGLGFLGYPYLAELAQRPEYRAIVEKYAGHATRKWIKLSGGDDAKLKRINELIEQFKVRESFRELGEHDGFFGRAQLYIDVGERNPAREITPLSMSSAKLKGLKGFKTIEPMWCYPGRYNSTDPRQADFYKPQLWNMNGNQIHASRMLTLVGREVPDMLKPAYAFGGLSRTQMAKPYVDNWLSTRQYVNDIIGKFSMFVLSTDMAAVLAGGSAGGLIDRVALMTEFRDNNGTLMLDKTSELFENVNAPLGSLDKLQTQAQEHMASVASIPLIELLGITPMGLNASSDGEIRTFYANIKDFQERVYREPLLTVIDILQMFEYGAIDPTIKFEFLDLWESDQEADAKVELARAQTDAQYVTMGAVSNEEIRERLAADETSIYHGLKLSGPAPDPVAMQLADKSAEADAQAKKDTPAKKDKP